MNLEVFRLSNNLQPTVRGVSMRRASREVHGIPFQLRLIDSFPCWNLKLVTCFSTSSSTSLDSYNKNENNRPEQFVCPYCSKFSSTLEKEYQHHIVLKHSFYLTWKLGCIYIKWYLSDGEEVVLLMSPRGPSGCGFLVDWYAQTAVIIGLFFAACIARWQKPYGYNTSGRYIARFV